MIAIIRILFIVMGAGLMACSSHYYKAYNADRIPVSPTIQKDAEIDSMIAPYRSALAVEMNRVIGEATLDLQVARPNSNLGQWVSDVLLAYGKDSLLKAKATDYPVIAIFNTGGIRSSLPKGNLTVGDVFKVMPFDNLIMALKLPVSQVPEIERYIRQTGGEPIAGCRIVHGELQKEDSTPLASGEYVWVITSDFLANGGDKMLFFQAATEKIMTGVLLRDLLMREIERTHIVNEEVEERITF